MSEENIPASYLPEIQLILYCSQVEIDDLIKAKIGKSLAKNLDWNYIYDFCNRHRIIPLVNRSLIKVNNADISAKVLDKFDNFTQKNTFRNLLFASKVNEIIEAFQKKNIATLSFKGSTLAVSAYNNIGLRTFCDQDLLIEEKNVITAIKVLNKLGYRQLNKKKDKEESASYIDYSIFIEHQSNQKSLVFTKNNQPYFIELHWSLSDRSFPVNIIFEDLWQNKTYLYLSGKKIPQFSIEDLLVYLCVHGSSHYWFKLKWICDVNELIRINPKLNWQKVWNIANKWGCVRMLCLGLILVKNLLNTKLPKHVEQTIAKDRVAKLLAAEVEPLLFNLSNYKFNSYIFLLKCRERNKDKLTYLISTIFTPNEQDWYFLKLPQKLHYLYYIIRPYRLLIQLIA